MPKPKKPPAPRPLPPVTPPVPSAPIPPSPPPRVLARFVLSHMAVSGNRKVLTLSPYGSQPLDDRTRFASTGSQIEIVLVNDPHGAPLEVGKEYIIDLRPA